MLEKIKGRTSVMMYWRRCIQFNEVTLPSHKKRWLNENAKRIIKGSYLAMEGAIGKVQRIGPLTLSLKVTEGPEQGTVQEFPVFAFQGFVPATQTISTRGRGYDG